MLFIEHFFKWCFAALCALVVAVFIGYAPYGISILLIDPPRYVNAARSVEASNLRQIGQASLIYATDHRGHLPDVADLPAYARQLALYGGLNEASVWVPHRADLPENAGTVLLKIADQPREQWPLNPDFIRFRPLFTVVLGGLTANDPSTTPIAWTRGLDPETGRWRPDSPYSGEGGHIVFLGGNVTFYRTLQNDSGGELIARDGRPTHRIRNALPPQARISPDPGATPPPPTFAERIGELLHSVPHAIRIVILWAWPLWMLVLFIKLTLAIVRSWGVPIARVRIELRPRWLILTPAALIALSIVFQV